jgi:hypothetical protein
VRGQPGKKSLRGRYFGDATLSSTNFGDGGSPGSESAATSSAGPELSGGVWLGQLGLLTATALFASVGDVQRFPSGRHFANYVGLTPREHYTGLQRHLGRISKPGAPYLRMLLTSDGDSSGLHRGRVPEDRRVDVVEPSPDSAFEKTPWRAVQVAALDPLTHVEEVSGWRRGQQLS